MITAKDDSPGHLARRTERGAQGNVHWLTVQRPARLNVLDAALIDMLRDALDVIAGDAEARAVVLCGAGERAWIGGADIGEMVDLDPEGARTFIAGLHGLCQGLRELPVPVVARIEGYCLGAGLEVAACCDLRLAATTASFGMPEVHVGIPSVIEAALLPRLIGSGRARDLVLTGRVITAEVAYGWGLVDALVAPPDLDALVSERLEAITRAAPRAIRAQKRLCRQWEDLPLAQAIEAGIDAFTAAYGSDEPRRCMRRFLDRPRGRSDEGGEGS